MSSAVRRREALLRLRRRLTLLAAGLTGAVLLVMALVALSIAEEQLRVSRESAFQSNINAIVAKIQADRIISTEWLAQTEATDRLIIALWDGGAPLRFSGAWTPETSRETLIQRARDEGTARGVDVDARPLSVIETTATPPFEVAGDHGDRYLAAVVLIPAHDGWQSLVLLRDMTGAERQVLLLRAAFAGLVVLGVVALLGLCWVLAGRAMAPVEASQRRQAEFVAAASHELRAPLAVIRTSASALRVEPERANALTDGIERECARMARLVEDLLSLAGMDAGSWSIRRERVDLDTLLLETADDFYPIARRKGQTLALEVPDEPLPSVTGDPQRLRQILSVLLDNACSYTPEGGTITLSGAVEGRWACLRTSDTGPGIGPEHLPHIFDRFYRADAARTGKGHFGLGLSIARELARLHGGELSVERTGPQGTVFLLRLRL